MDRRENVFLEVMAKLKKVNNVKDGARVLTSVFKQDFRDLGLNGAVFMWNALATEEPLPELNWALYLLGREVFEFPFVIRMAQIIGRLETMLLILEAGIGLNNMTNFRQNKLLLEAAYQGRCACLKILIEEGADVNTKDEDQDTPLILAACNGFDKVVALLIEKGADVNAINSFGSSALMYACDGNFDEVVRLLLAAGADVSIVERDGGTALLWAAYGGSVGCVRMVLKKGANVNESDNHGYSALFSAAMHGNLECVERLLDAGADVNAETVEDETPLIAAAAAGSAPVVKRLLKAGAQVNHVNIYCQTALTVHVARCEPISYDLCRILVKAGCLLVATDALLVEKYTTDCDVITYAKIPAFLQYDQNCHIVKLDQQPTTDGCLTEHTKATPKDGTTVSRTAEKTIQGSKPDKSKIEVTTQTTHISPLGKSADGAGVKNSNAKSIRGKTDEKKNEGQPEDAKKKVRFRLFGQDKKSTEKKKRRKSKSSREENCEAKTKVTFTEDKLQNDATDELVGRIIAMEVATWPDEMIQWIRSEAKKKKEAKPSGDGTRGESSSEEKLKQKEERAQSERQEKSEEKGQESKRKSEEKLSKKKKREIEKQKQDEERAELMGQVIVELVGTWPDEMIQGMRSAAKKKGEAKPPVGDGSSVKTPRGTTKRKVEETMEMKSVEERVQSRVAVIARDVIETLDEAQTGSDEEDDDLECRCM